MFREDTESDAVCSGPSGVPS